MEKGPPPPPYSGPPPVQPCAPPPPQHYAPQHPPAQPQMYPQAPAQPQYAVPAPAPAPMMPMMPMMQQQQSSNTTVVVGGGNTQPIIRKQRFADNFIANFLLTLFCPFWIIIWICLVHDFPFSPIPKAGGSELPPGEEIPQCMMKYREAGELTRESRRT